MDSTEKGKDYAAPHQPLGSVPERYPKMVFVGPAVAAYSAWGEHAQEEDAYFERKGLLFLNDNVESRLLFQQCSFLQKYYTISSQSGTSSRYPMLKISQSEDEEECLRGDALYRYIMEDTGITLIRVMEGDILRQIVS
jgi:hypothetical protein